MSIKEGEGKERREIKKKKIKGERGDILRERRIEGGEVKRKIKRERGEMIKEKRRERGKVIRTTENDEK